MKEKVSAHSNVNARMAAVVYSNLQKYPPVPTVSATVSKVMVPMNSISATIMQTQGTIPRLPPCPNIGYWGTSVPRPPALNVQPRPQAAAPWPPTQAWALPPN